MPYMSKVEDKVEDKVAVFCTGDKKYVPMMIASLGMTALKNPVEPWIITDADDQETKDLISKCNIGYIHHDLHEHFQTDEISKHWPSQSFWWSIGPETLLALGYKYSIFIDADIYCNMMIDPSIFTDDLEIAAHQCKPENKPEQYNSGVIVFNNEKMVEKRLWSSFLNCYRGMSTSLFEKYHGGKVHDQQVLSALKDTTKFSKFLGNPYSFDIQDLNFLWNYRFEKIEGKNQDFIGREYEELTSQVYFFHFLNSQPWLPYEKWGSRNHGLFPTNEFPEGVINKKWKEEEPNLMTRVKCVEDWRDGVREIEKLKDVTLFDDFGSLEKYKEQINANS